MPPRPPDRAIAAPPLRRAWRSLALPAVALLLGADRLRAEEIAPFKLTGVDGYATLQYASDEQTTAQPGAARSRQAQSGWRNEIFAMTHSYVYHPNLLTLDIGGGPILHGDSYSGDTESAQRRGLLYNFSARANFLRDKPYTGTLFFSHLNPSVSVAPGQVLTQENVRYGFDFSLLAPATPVPVQLGFVRSQTRGRGADRVVDDRIDQFNATATRSFGALGHTQLQFQASQQASKSGSLDLPVQSSSAGNHALNIDTRLQFGDDRQYDLTNVISVNEQTYALDTGAVPALKDVRVMFDARARHSDKLHTYGFYNYGRNSQGALDTTSQAASAGVSYWPAKGLEASLGGRADSSATQQFQARSQGLDGSVRYEAELPPGAAQASYGARFDRRQQVAAFPQTPVIGERLTLSGTAYISLGHPHIVAGSPLVSNAARSQTYVAGIDYSLLVVGTETRIQRLIGGRILDGEVVLVDYSYDVGGTYAYDQFDQTLNLNWNLSRHLGVYYRRFVSDPRLVSGIPGFPLNQVTSSTYGAHADLPLNPGVALSLGGNLEREERHESISPYLRTSFDSYLQTDEPLFGLGFLRASTRRSRIDYANALQNSDLRSVELRYWTRQWFGIDLTAALNAERDDAGLLPRQRRDGSIGARWQERKFSLSANFLRTVESQGGVDRSRTVFQILARREL